MATPTAEEIKNARAYAEYYSKDFDEFYSAGSIENADDAILAFYNSQKSRADFADKMSKVTSTRVSQKALTSNASVFVISDPGLPGIAKDAMRYVTAGDNNKIAIPSVHTYKNLAGATSTFTQTLIVDKTLLSASGDKTLFKVSQPAAGTSPAQDLVSFCEHEDSVTKARSYYADLDAKLVESNEELKSHATKITSGGKDSYRIKVSTFTRTPGGILRFKIDGDLTLHIDAKHIDVRKEIPAPAPIAGAPAGPVRTSEKIVARSVYRPEEESLMFTESPALLSRFIDKTNKQCVISRVVNPGSPAARTATLTNFNDLLTNFNPQELSAIIQQNGRTTNGVTTYEIPSLNVKLSIAQISDGKTPPTITPLMVASDSKNFYVLTNTSVTGRMSFQRIKEFTFTSDKTARSGKTFLLLQSTKDDKVLVPLSKPLPTETRDAFNTMIDAHNIVSTVPNRHGEPGKPEGTTDPASYVFYKEGAQHITESRKVEQEEDKTAAPTPTPPTTKKVEKTTFNRVTSEREAPPQIQRQPFKFSNLRVPGWLCMGAGAMLLVAAVILSGGFVLPFIGAGVGLTMLGMGLTAVGFLKDDQKHALEFGSEEFLSQKEKDYRSAEKTLQRFKDLMKLRGDSVKNRSLILTRERQLAKMVSSLNQNSLQNVFNALSGDDLKLAREQFVSEFRWAIARSPEFDKFDLTSDELKNQLGEENCTKLQDAKANADDFRVHFEQYMADNKQLKAEYRRQTRPFGIRKSKGTAIKNRLDAMHFEENCQLIMGMSSKDYAKELRRDKSYYGKGGPLARYNRQKGERKLRVVQELNDRSSLTTIDLAGSYSALSKDERKTIKALYRHNRRDLTLSDTKLEEQNDRFKSYRDQQEIDEFKQHGPGERDFDATAESVKKVDPSKMDIKKETIEEYVPDTSAPTATDYAINDDRVNTRTELNPEADKGRGLTS